MPERTRATDEAAAAVRPFWSGTITFGLVSIPVNLYPANRSNRVSLRMVTAEGTPLARRYFAPRDGRPLDSDDIVRGYEVEKDRYVVLEDEELERLAPERTRDIDLRVFVEASAIDPMHFERAYFLTPAGTSTKAYRLLAHVMEETGRAGIATFVMRAREYLVAILAERGILRAETLRFADELRTPDDVGLPEPQRPKPASVKAVEKEIAKRAEKRLDVDELVDPSAERLLKLVKKKARSGRDVVRPETPRRDEGPPVIDLMEVLKRSLKGSAASDVADGAGSVDDDLGERPRAELYEQAKALDIPGRSAMNKAELIEAIHRSA